MTRSTSAPRTISPLTGSRSISLARRSTSFSCLIYIDETEPIPNVNCGLCLFQRSSDPEGYAQPARRNFLTRWAMLHFAAHPPYTGAGIDRSFLRRKVVRSAVGRNDMQMDDK